MLAMPAFTFAYSGPYGQCLLVEKIKIRQILDQFNIGVEIMGPILDQFSIGDEIITQIVLLLASGEL